MYMYIVAVRGTSCPCIGLVSERANSNPQTVLVYSNQQPVFLSLFLSLPALLMAKRRLNDSVGAKQIKVMLADDGNDDALSIFLANIQVIQLQIDLEQVLGNDSLLSVT